MRDISNLKGKIFRHFKGDLYLVEDFVKHSETQETMVLYRALIQQDKNTDFKNTKLRALNSLHIK